MTIQRKAPRIPIKLKSYNELRENYNKFWDKWVSEDTYNKYINYKDSLLRDREDKIILAKKKKNVKDY